MADAYITAEQLATAMRAATLPQVPDAAAESTPGGIQVCDPQRQRVPTMVYPEGPQQIARDIEAAAAAHPEVGVARALWDMRSNRWYLEVLTEGTGDGLEARWGRPLEIGTHGRVRRCGTAVSDAIDASVASQHPELPYLDERAERGTGA